MFNIFWSWSASRRLAITIANYCKGECTIVVEIFFQIQQVVMFSESKTIFHRKNRHN